MALAQIDFSKLPVQKTSQSQGIDFSKLPIQRSMETSIKEEKYPARLLSKEEVNFLRQKANVQLIKQYGIPDIGSGIIEAFAQGLLPINKNKYPDVALAHPIAHATGQLTGLIATSALTGGIAPSVAGSKIIEMLPQIAREVGGRIAGSAIQTGVTFGAKELIDNMAEIVGGENKSVKGIVSDTLKASAFGSGLGITGSLASPFARIPAQATYGFLTAKLQKADNLEAGLNAGLFALFGLFNTKNLKNQYILSAREGAKQALYERLNESGIDKSKTGIITDRFFDVFDRNVPTIRNYNDFSKAMSKGYRIVIEKNIPKESQKQVIGLLESKVPQKPPITLPIQKVPIHPMQNIPVTPTPAIVPKVTPEVTQPTIPVTPQVTPSGEIVTPFELLGKKGYGKLLETYKGKQILELNNGEIAVYDTTDKKLFRVSLDDSTLHHKMVPEANNVETARKYIDWVKGVETKQLSTPAGEVKTELISAPKTEVPTKGVVLDKIEGKVEPQLETQQMGKSPSLQKMGIVPKPEMITTREDVLLRRRIRDEARGAKEGAVEARRIAREELIQKFKNSQETIKNIRKDLMQYIDENLPAEAKGKLINPLVMDNLTRKKAASIFSRVDRIKDTITRRQLINEIEKLSVPKGNMAVDHQKKVIDIIDGIDLVKPTAITLRRLKGLRDYIQREGMPSDIQAKYIEKLDRLSQKNVSEMTTGDLQELKETFARLKQLGKLKLELKYKYNARERKVALDRLLASSQNLDTKVSGRRTKLDIYKVGTIKVYMDTLPTPRVADMIDGFKNYQGENAKLIKQLGDKETIAKNNTRVITTIGLEEMQKLGVQDLTKEQQLNMMINIRYREVAFDQVKTLMDANGLKDIPKLTEQENQIIEIIKKYTNQNVDNISAIYEEIENKPFNKIAEYILPIKYENDFNLIPSQTIEQGRFRTTQTFKGFTYERQKGVTKVPRTDILAIFEEAINDQQWYLNMQPELENIKYLVKSEEYLNKAGEMASNWWRTELDVVARRGWSATARSNPVLRQARINLNSAILGYKLSSIFMQPFAIFDAMAYIETRFGIMATLEVLKEFSKAWIIPKYAKQIITESPSLQVRQGGELAIEEVLKKAGRLKGLYNAYLRGGMSLLQKADIRTAAGVEQGIINVLKKYKVPDFKAESDFLMQMVSGSNEVTYRPHILSSGEGARTWFTFQTFFLNRWGILMHDIIISGLIKGGGKEGFEGLRKRIAALVGLGIFISGAIAENESRKVIYETTTGNKLQDESMAKIAMMFIPEQIPFFGNLISAADRNNNANPPVLRTLENIFKGGFSLIKGKKPETRIRGGLRMGESIVTLGAGIPGTAQFFDLLEGIFLKKKKTFKVVPRGKY